MPEPPGPRKPGEPSRRPADFGPRPGSPGARPGRLADRVPPEPSKTPNPEGGFGQDNMDDMLAEARAALTAGRIEKRPRVRIGVGSGLRAVLMLFGAAGILVLLAAAIQAGPEILTWWRLESAVDEVILDVQNAPERRAAMAMGREPPDIRPILESQIAKVAQTVREGFSPDELHLQHSGDDLHLAIRWTASVNLVVYHYPLTFAVTRKIPARPPAIQRTQ